MRSIDSCDVVFDYQSTSTQEKGFDFQPSRLLIVYNGYTYIYTGYTRIYMNIRASLNPHAQCVTLMHIATSQTSLIG